MDNPAAEISTPMEMVGAKVVPSQTLNETCDIISGLAAKIN